MSITVKKIALPELCETTMDDTSPINNPLSLVGNVEVNCYVRIGTLTLTIAELSQLKQGQILKLAESTQDPVDIILNQRVIARGELMSCDDCFAVQITEIAGNS
jgi:flagellar motor switch protein FliN/FliY